MELGYTCIGLSVVALILCNICGRRDSVLALPMVFAFVILLIAGILSLVFSETVALIAIIVMIFILLNTFLP